MKPIAILIAAALVLSACSSARHTVTRVAAPATTTFFATGPIYSACRASDRKQASRARCGCVQAVADRSLSGSEQSRGAAFFKDPHRAQETRQSDRPGDERFWLRWKDYSAQAARICT